MKSCKPAQRMPAQRIASEGQAGEADAFDRSPGAAGADRRLARTVEDAAGLEHGELEALLEREGRELLRALLQDQLDLRGVASRVWRGSLTRGVARPAVERDHRRQLSSLFGEVSVGRLAYRARGEENLYVADGVLNLPTEHASHGVRRLAARAAAAGSFEDATEPGAGADRA